MRGGEGFANRIGNGLDKLADGLGKFLEKRREEGKLEVAAGKAALATLQSSPELQKFISVEDAKLLSPGDQAKKIYGTIAGISADSAVKQERARMEKAIMDMAAQKQEAEGNTAFDLAQSNAVGKTLVSALNQRQGPIQPQPVALDDLVQQIVQTPGAGRSKAGSALLERALMERAKMQPAMQLPPGARPTGGTLGPNGVSTTFTMDNGRQSEQPTQIFLKDGTPTQKAMYSDGTIIDLPADKSKALTDAQANALQFSERMAFNNNVLAKLESEGFDATGAGAAAQKWTPNVMTGEKFQSYDAARKNWIAAVLRKESGAAISKSEEKGALEQYFPAFGDAPSVVKQKAELRALAETNMRRAIGGIENQASATATGKTIPRFDSEEAARAAKIGTNVFEMYDPATASYRKARLK